MDDILFITDSLIYNLPDYTDIRFSGRLIGNSNEIISMLSDISRYDSIVISLLHDDVSLSGYFNTTPLYRYQDNIMQIMEEFKEGNILLLTSFVHDKHISLTDLHIYNDALREIKGDNIYMLDLEHHINTDNITDNIIRKIGNMVDYTYGQINE